jgi:hypothetical protein
MKDVAVEVGNLLSAPQDAKLKRGARGYGRGGLGSWRGAVGSVLSWRG